VERIDSSSKESWRYASELESSATDKRDVAGLIQREVVAMNRSERSFARSLGRPHASCSRAS